MAMKPRGKSQSEWPVVSNNTGRTLTESTQRDSHKHRAGGCSSNSLRVDATGTVTVPLKSTEVRSGQKKAKLLVCKRGQKLHQRHKSEFPDPEEI